MLSRSPRPVPTTSNRLATCGAAGCSRLFAVCGSCDRGRRYCSEECAALVRRAQTRRAGILYQASERGRQAHAARQAHYRAKRSRVTHQPVAASSDLREISLATEQGTDAAARHVARSPLGPTARGRSWHRRRLLVLRSALSVVADRAFFERAFTPPRGLAAILLAFAATPWATTPAFRGVGRSWGATRRSMVSRPGKAA